MSMKEYKLTNVWGQTDNVWFSKAQYDKKYGGGLAIQMWCDDGPYATLTVNLHPEKCKENCAFIDTNNLGNRILGWLEENGIAHWTYRVERSGYCEYPEVEFDADFLASL